MLLKTIFKILLISPATYASTTPPIFVEVGEKIQLKGQGPFHFSAKKEKVKVFPDSTPPFFTPLRVGSFEYYDKKNRHRVFSLNKPQLDFYDAIKSITELLPEIQWDLKTEKLILSASNLSPTVRNFLIQKCLSFGKGEVSLDLPSLKENTTIPQACSNSLRPKSERKIELLILNKRAGRHSNYGLGAPPSIGWEVDANRSLNLASQQGALNLDKGSLNSKDSNRFQSRISVGQPLRFETGSEVGIQPKGIFNRNAVEWKKATTLIDLEMIEAQQEEVKLKITLNKRSRTAQNSVFELEKLEKTAFLERERWQMILSYSDKSKNKMRNGALGLGLTGSASSSKADGEKEIWVRVQNVY